MKKALLITFLLIMATTLGVSSEPEALYPYDLQVDKLYAQPDENSRLIYDIPISVKLLDISPDANWFKVRLSFSLGPLSYTYVGWAKIPLGDILAAREKELDSASAVQ